MKRLLELLSAARQRRYTGPAPEASLDGLEGDERRLAEEVVALLTQHYQLATRHRRARALQLSDADALGESLSRIGLGDFETPVQEVRSAGMDTIRMGIEDMTRRLKESTDKLEENIVELRHERELAEAATRAKSSFLANMSHEIRTPLNAILGLSHLALSSDLNARQRGYVRKIEGSGRVLLSLVNDVLDFSKIEAGKLELDREVFHVQELVENISDMFSANVSAKGLELVAFVAPDVPRSVEGDQMRLGQVLINLVGNAIKFTEEGEIVVNVSLERQDDEHAWLRFEVRDSGVGFDMAHAPELFKSFTQADNSATRKHGGTGLGLAICHSIVELMQGRIEVESAPGEGSTFWFTARCDVADAEAEAAPSYDLPAKLRGRRVLIVEDHAISQAVLCEYLTSFGLEYIACDTGEAALDAVRTAERPFDLALMDWKLPGINGIETTLRLKRDLRQQRLPVVLMTAYSTEEVWRQAMESGVVAFLVKPIKQSQLFNTIIEGLDTSVRRAREEGAPVFTDEATLDHLIDARVLLVEDNAINQQVATELLERVRVRVDVADNGLEAVRRLAAREYDAVLMDVQMPVMDGLSATRVIREGRWTHDTEQEPVLIPEARRAVPVIAMTAHSLKGDREKCLSAGMNAYIKKPIDVAELYRTLAAHIEATSGPAVVRAATPAPLPKGEADLARPEAGEDLPSSLPGVDVRAGIARVGGNERLYRKLLHEFARDHRDAASDIEARVQVSDWEQAQRAAHTLKGIAATLGAAAVSRAAAEIETTLERRRTERMPWLLERLVRELGPVMAAVAGLDASAAGAPPTRPATPPGEGVGALVERLADEIDRRNLRAARTADGLRQALPGQASLVDAIVDAIGRLDFGAAGQTLGKLLESLPVDKGGAS